MGQSPLSVCPGVVVLAVVAERFASEGQLAKGRFESGDDRAAMLPVVQMNRLMSKDSLRAC